MLHRQTTTATSVCSLLVSSRLVIETRHSRLFDDQKCTTSAMRHPRMTQQQKALQTPLTTTRQSFHKDQNCPSSGRANRLSVSYRLIILYRIIRPSSRVPFGGAEVQWRFCDYFAISAAPIRWIGVEFVPRSRQTGSLWEIFFHFCFAFDCVAISSVSIVSNQPFACAQ